MKELINALSPLKQLYIIIVIVVKKEVIWEKEL